MVIGALRQVRFLHVAILYCSLTVLARADVNHVPIKSDIHLSPNQFEQVTIDAADSTEIGWTTTQAQACTTPCIKATDKLSGNEYSMTLPLGGSMKYAPVDGKISIEYKNVSQQDVSIDVYQVKRTCRAESCALLNAKEERHWLVYKVDEFTSIETSKDKSYSTISGRTISGKPFTLKAIWWSDDSNAATALLFSCSEYIKKYLDDKTPKEKYNPYIISGAAGADKTILTNIDTCVPQAPKFGVPEENVYQ